MSDDQQILRMLKSIVAEIDYDLYKDIFCYSDPEAKELIAKLIQIVKDCQPGV